MARLVFSLYLVSATVGLQVTGSESSCADGRVISSWSNWTCVSKTDATRNGYCEDNMYPDIIETAKNCSACRHQSVQDSTGSKFVSCCKDSVKWTQPWTCDSTTFKTASRVGECTSDGVPVEVTQRVNVNAYSWTSWSPWLPRCGSDHRSRNRSCEVPSSDGPFCSTCGYQNVTASQKVPANLPPCCEDYPFGSWSPWIPDCSLPVSGVTPVNQSRTRSRECNISSDCTPCPLDVETRAGILQSWSDWGEWSGSPRPCICSGKVYRCRRRSCPNVTNPDGYPVTSCCNSSSEDVKYSCNGSVATTLCTLSSVSPTADSSVWTLSSLGSTVATDDVFSTSAETELTPSFSQSTQEYFPLKPSSTAIFHSFLFSSAASTTSSPSEPSPTFSTTASRLSPSRASSSAHSPAFPSTVTSSGPLSMPSSPAASHTPVFSSTTSESINISPSEPSSTMISFTTYSHVFSSAHSLVELSSFLQSSFFTTMTWYTSSPGPLVTLSSAIISLSPLSSSATHSYASMTNNIHSPSIFSLAGSTTRPSPSKLRSTTTSLHFPSSSSVVLTPSQHLRSSSTAPTALRSGPVTSTNSLSLHLPLFPVSSSPVGSSPTGQATGPPGYVWGIVAAAVLAVAVVATVVVGLAVRKCVHLYRKRREGYVRVLTNDDEDEIYPI